MFSVILRYKFRVISIKKNNYKNEDCAILFYKLFQKSQTYHRSDVFDLLPESFATAVMMPDAVGTWLLHCHVNIHMDGGMNALFTVLAPTSEFVGERG